jgi:hypothetical protein
MASWEWNILWYPSSQFVWFSTLPLHLQPPINSKDVFRKLWD